MPPNNMVTRGYSRTAYCSVADATSDPLHCRQRQANPLSASQHMLQRVEETEDIVMAD